MYSFEEFDKVLLTRYGIHSDYTTSIESKYFDGPISLDKCMNSYWYYLKNVFVPYTANAKDRMNFKINIVNYTISRLLKAGVNNIIEINIDSIGAGTAIDAWLVYKAVFDNVGPTTDDENCLFNNNLFLNLDITSYHRDKLRAEVYDIPKHLLQTSLSRQLKEPTRILYVDDIDLCTSDIEEPSIDPNYFKIYSGFMSRKLHTKVSEQCKFISKINKMSCPVSLSDLKLSTVQLREKFNGRYALITFDVNMLTDNEVFMQ